MTYFLYVAATPTEDGWDQRFYVSNGHLSTEVTENDVLGAIEIHGDDAAQHLGEQIAWEYQTAC